MNNELIEIIKKIKIDYLEKIEDLKKELQKYNNISLFLTNYKIDIFSYELLSSFYSLLNLDENLDYYRKVSITYKALKEKYPERSETYKEVLDNLYEIVQDKYHSLDQSIKVKKQIEAIEKKLVICDKVISMLETNKELVSVSEIEYMLSDIEDLKLVVGITISLQSIYERKIKKEVVKKDRIIEEQEVIENVSDSVYPKLSENLSIKSKMDVYETASSISESKRLVGIDVKTASSKDELTSQKEYLEMLDEKEATEDRKSTEIAAIKNCEEILIEWNSEYLETYKNILDLLKVLNNKYDELDFQKYSDEGYIIYTKLKEEFDTFVNTVEDYYKALIVKEDIDVYQELLNDDYTTLINTYQEMLELLKKENVNITEKQSDNKLVYVMTPNNTPCALQDVKKIPKEYHKTIIELLDSIKDNIFRDSKPCNVNPKIKGVNVVRHTQKKLRIIYKRVKDNYYAILGICVKKDDMSKDYLDFVTRRYEYYLNSEQEINRLLNDNKEEFITMEDGITLELYNNLGLDLNNSGRNRGENNE